MQKTIHTPSLTYKETEKNSVTFVVEPLLSGYGMTLGNSLRRVLLSSIAGAAVVAFRVEGATHEFTTLPGVKEDALEIMLNIKSLRFKLSGDDDSPQSVFIKKKGPGPVRGADISGNPNLEVVNKDHLIATLDSAKDTLEIELIVAGGRGYMTAEDNQDSYPTGFIVVDALFSPVLRVRYSVEDTRIGQKTNLDKLSVIVETDGSMSAKDAFEDASAILKAHYEQLSGATEVDSDSFANQVIEAEDGGDSESPPTELRRPIEDLNLSARTANALNNNDIHTLADLVDLSDASLKELKGFGSKALEEVKQKMQQLEL